MPASAATRCGQAAGCLPAPDPPTLGTHYGCLCVWTTPPCVKQSQLVVAAFACLQLPHTTPTPPPLRVCWLCCPGDHPG